MKKIKIAIFYDWLNQWGGAERLLLSILDIYPNAHLFTTVYDPDKTRWLPKTNINASVLNRFLFFKKNNFLSVVLQSMAIQSFDFSPYDVLISITSQSGHSLITPPQTCHICYCLTPNRYLYQRKYPRLLQPFVNLYKRMDYILSQRPDFYLTISNTVHRRIRKFYKRPSVIVYPGVDTTKFKPPIKNYQHQKYFLIVSRLVEHKRIDLAIKACLSLNQKLIIVGTGRYLHHLRHLAKNNSLIIFKNKVSDKKLVRLYQGCQALICPQLEDFGLTSLEAQACGKPVIAYAKGGIAETVIHQKTGLLFKNQSLDSLVETILHFNEVSFSAQDCQRNADRFNQTRFVLEFSKQIEKIWSLHQKKVTLTT